MMILRIPGILKILFRKIQENQMIKIRWLTQTNHRLIQISHNWSIQVRVQAISKRMVPNPSTLVQVRSHPKISEITIEIYDKQEVVSAARPRDDMALISPMVAMEACPIKCNKIANNSNSGLQEHLEWQIALLVWWEDKIRCRVRNNNMKKKNIKVLLLTMNTIMYLELDQVEALQERQVLEIKLPNPEEIGEATDSKTSNQAVVLMEANQTWEGQIGTTTIAKADKVEGLN